MKLSYKDLINGILIVLIAAIAFAKYNSYNWAGIESWRDAVAATLVIGLVIYLINGFDFANRSILNIIEMVLGASVIIVAFVGLFTYSQALFYVTSSFLAVIVLIDVLRHTRQSLLRWEIKNKPIFHYHAHG